MLTIWTRIGGAVLLVFVLGLLTKGIADVGELTGTVSALVSRVDNMQTEMNSRFVQIENRMDNRFAQIDNRFAQIENRFVRIENRFVRIENILMGRAPDADDVGDAAVPDPAGTPTVPTRFAARKPH